MHHLSDITRTAAILALLTLGAGAEPSAQEIVAGKAGLGRDTCNGDSGGPLLLLPQGATGEGALVLAGVTSRAIAGSSTTQGLACGDGGIYVRLTPENIDFVMAE